MATSQAGIQAAYATEINDCSFNTDSGLRKRSRPQYFCDSVEIAKTLDVTMTATFDVPIEVAESVNVDRVPYMPATIQGLGASGMILTANGVPITLATPPVPSEVFQDITINGTLTMNGTASLDAGNY